MSGANSTLDLEPIQGHVDGFIGDTIYGWINCPPGARAALRIDRKTLIHVKTTVQRPDVKLALDLDTDTVGFDAFIPAHLFDGRTRNVELLSVGNDSISVVIETELKFIRRSTTPSEQLEKDRPAGSARRAAVVCWDLAHNPAGRAMVLYDILAQEYDTVDLIGPIFPRFGREIWAPLQSMGLNVVTQIVENHAELLQFCQEAAKQKYEFVWICKPRLPGLLVALHIIEKSGCKVALDIDDYEMSFFNDKLGRELIKNVMDGVRSDRIHPADFDATALAHKYVNSFKLKTVSNIALQRTFGGEILPHARSIKSFDPEKYSKADKKKGLGISDSATVIAFIGTIRKHKGILSVADAVGKLGSDIVLLVAGTYESDELKRDIEKLTKGRVKLCGLVPFEDLPSFLVAADAICLPQDIESETSAYQLPAKLIDGLALGLKVLVNDLPAYENLRHIPGLFIRKNNEPMELAVDRMLRTDVDRIEARQSFEKQLSIESNAIKVSAQFGAIRADECLMPLQELCEEVLGRPLDTGKPKFAVPARIAKSRDLVVLWKQVDSGLFGRRVDMVPKYLTACGAFDRVIVLDAPMSSWDYSQLQQRATFPGLTNSRIVHDGVVRKFLIDQTEPSVVRKVFITSECGERVLGRELPRRDELSREIGAFFDQVKVGEDAVLLVYPVAAHLSDTLQVRRFSRVIVDLVDDEREFTVDSAVRDRKHDAYVQALSAADAVITNNETMRQRFQGISSCPIHVVQNGVEEFDKTHAVRLTGIKGKKKVLGYVGNLRDRIDVGLILAVANEVPDVHVLLVGPTGGNRDVERLRFHPNISMAGAVTYEESRRISAGFDVGIIPHTLDSLSDSMNPLKFYLYKQLELPIVSTPIRNLGSFNGNVYLSDGSVEGFTSCINMALRKDKRPRSYWRMGIKSDLWSTRAEVIRKVCGL